MPLCTPEFIILPSGESIVIRLLEPADAPNLIDYFSSLSKQTKFYFAPHPFDSETVTTICTTLDPAECIRLVASSPDHQKIIAYALLQSGASPSDRSRYKAIDIHLRPETDFSFAPSIADLYQSQGLGSRILKTAIAIARIQHKQRIILWGGVQANNERAIRYYQKHGFVRMTQFERNGLNYSMCLHLT